MKVGIKIAVCCLILLAVPKTARAEAVTVSLNVSSYDTFNETVEIRYTGTAKGTVRLNEYNNYKETLEWVPGTYNVTAAVRNDRLELFWLHPTELEVRVEEGEEEEILIQVTDAGGMGSGANDYIHSEAGETASEEGPDIPERVYEWGDETEAVGSLKITAPDISGLKTIVYSLCDEQGNIYPYVLYKENRFTATVKLPYGNYTETGDPEITAEEGIIIPNGTQFKFGYYQDSFGQTFHISQDRAYLENPPNMKLLLILGDGESIEIKNLYQFSGNDVLLNAQAASIETGHYEVWEREMETQKEELPEQSKDRNGKQISFTIILACVLFSFLVICVVIYRIFFCGGDRNGQ